MSDRFDELVRDRAVLVDAQESVFAELRRLDRRIEAVDAELEALFGRGEVGGA